MNAMCEVSDEVRLARDGRFEPSGRFFVKDASSLGASRLRHQELDRAEASSTSFDDLFTEWASDAR